jgi:hypothetical protein
VPNCGRFLHFTYYVCHILPNIESKTFKFDFVGLATLIAVYILKIPDLGTEDVASVLDWVFSIIFLTYCLGSGIMNIYTNYGYTEGCKAIGYPL